MSFLYHLNLTLPGLTKNVREKVAGHSSSSKMAERSPSGDQQGARSDQSQPPQTGHNAQRRVNATSGHANPTVASQQLRSKRPPTSDKCNE